MKSQVEEWYRDRTKRVNQIIATLHKSGKPKYKDFLEKVPQAGPMGCVIRRMTSTSIALKHWHFASKILGESEQSMKDSGYM